MSAIMESELTSSSGEGFLLVYAITSRNSFEEVSTFHQQILRVSGDHRALLTNRSKTRITSRSLSSPTSATWSTSDRFRRMVSQYNMMSKADPLAEGRELAKRFNAQCIETSAKQRVNVDEAFIAVVRAIRRYQKVSQAGDD